MVDQFTIGFKTQKSWGALAAVDFFLGGTGAGTFLLSMYLNVVPGMVIGWVAVVLGALALLVDLGRPGRFVKAGSQVASSWISRGAVLTSLFLVLGVLSIAATVSGTPWGRNTGLGQTVSVLTTISALGVMMYTGFLLSHSPSIPFWNTSFVPLLFAFNGFTCGVGVILVLASAVGNQAMDLRAVQLVGISLLAASLVFLWVYLLNMAFSTVAAKESVRLLVNGKLAPLFLFGVTVVGLVLPLGLTAAVYFGDIGPGVTSATLALAGILILIGGYLFRHSVLKAGVYPPVIDV